MCWAGKGKSGAAMFSFTPRLRVSYRWALMLTMYLNTDTEQEKTLR